MNCRENNKSLDYNKIQIIIYYRLGVRILSYLILSYLILSYAPAKERLAPQVRAERPLAM
ncbi:MAG: hypothetical protein ABIL44_03355 [candidate division WOR-3 bacterium]